MVKFLSVDSTSFASVSEATTVMPVRTSSEAPVSISTNSEALIFTSTSSEGNLTMTQLTVNYTYLTFRTICGYKSK